MTKIQIGWHAMNGDGEWKYHIYDRNNLPVVSRKADKWTEGYKTAISIPDYLHIHHLEQPEIDWKDSLKPVFIEV